MDAVAHAADHFAGLRERGHEARALPAELLEELRNLLGDRLTTSGPVGEHHGTDVSSYPDHLCNPGKVV